MFLENKNYLQFENEIGIKLLQGKQVQQGVAQIQLWYESRLEPIQIIVLQVTRLVLTCIGHDQKWIDKLATV